MQYWVHLDELELDFACHPGQSVLDCMIGSGKKGIQVGCRGGGCGVCKVEVIEGDYIARPMSKAHIDNDAIADRQVLACCITPKSDLSLKVVGKINKPIQRKGKQA
ncbi:MULTISPECIES: 2Fe-2S iron-sulfur cluster-binding protein [Marinobacter]|uniref:2Fe-2S iron-sulfur cluster-binding protein n=1 Tax=Marinobacter TaxID=2742 RepID=UPI001247468B|nr:MULTISPECIES: 2Fe-2S iron-sulfur cluster-binding protein [Marinobacter]MBL3556368.1 2Fe-2S iron-sulfur cluster binding domain-containing protein [Marinobacter sp. JB05H06]